MDFAMMAWRLGIKRVFIIAALLLYLTPVLGCILLSPLCHGVISSASAQKGSYFCEQELDTAMVVDR